MSGTLPEWAQYALTQKKAGVQEIVSVINISEASELVGSCDDILEYLWCDSVDETPEQIAERVQAWRESIVERAESAVTDIINRSEAA